LAQPLQGPLIGWCQ